MAQKLTLHGPVSVRIDKEGRRKLRGLRGLTKYGVTASKLQRWGGGMIRSGYSPKGPVSWLKRIQGGGCHNRNQSDLAAKISSSGGGVARN